MDEKSEEGESWGAKGRKKGAEGEVRDGSEKREKGR